MVILNDMIMGYTYLYSVGFFCLFQPLNIFWSNEKAFVCGFNTLGNREKMLMFLKKNDNQTQKQGNS